MPADAVVGGRGRLVRRRFVHDLAPEQMRIALLALAGAAAEPHDQLALDQAVEHGVQLGGGAEVVQPLGALEQLAGRLRPAQHQHREQRLLVAPEAHLLLEQVAVLGRAAAAHRAAN